MNSENATVGNVLQSGAITTVPLNGRTVDRLIRISAGVTTDNSNNPRVAGSPYWGGISFNVDGVGYNDSGNGGGAYSYRHGLSTQPSVDAIGEFKIDSNSMKAEFESGVSVTVVTKSGTNQIHGSALWFNRNREYAAQNFFQTSQPKAPFNRNELGGTIGGPSSKTSCSSSAASKTYWNEVQSRLPVSPSLPAPCGAETSPGWLQSSIL